MTALLNDKEALVIELTQFLQFVFKYQEIKRHRRAAWPHLQATTAHEVLAARKI